MKAADTNRARSALAGFTPAKITGVVAAKEWQTRNAPAAPPAADTAIGRYLAGGWRETNATIRRQKTPPPDVPEIDAEFKPSGEDMVLRRTVPMDMFAHIPIDDLVGMKVRDAAYASTQLDHSELGPSAGGAVTMHIAAAEGTAIYVVGDTGEILLARDTEIAISRAEPNGEGGWDLYGVVIPKTAVKRQDRGDTPATDGDTALDEPATDGDTALDEPATDGDTALAEPATDGDTDDGQDTPPAAPEKRPNPRQDPVGYARAMTDAELLTSASRRGILPRLRRAVAAEQVRRAELAGQPGGGPFAAANADPQRTTLDDTVTGGFLYFGDGDRPAAVGVPVSTQQLGRGRQSTFTFLDHVDNKPQEGSRGVQHRPRDRVWLAPLPPADVVDAYVTGIRDARRGGRPLDTGDQQGARQDAGTPGTAQPTGTTVSGARDTQPPSGEVPPQQLDITGGTTAFGGTRTDVGLPERPQVGRERAIAQVQQLGLFASDEREMAGQEALLDALLSMPAGPASEPPPEIEPQTPAAATPPARPTSIVPDDLTNWNDEQLAALFRQVSAVDDMADLDEPGMRRITEEWDRREQAMADLVATVPEDLAPLSDDDLEALFAKVTGELGTMDDATVDRLGAEMDRRSEAARKTAEDAPKRALLARPVGDLTDEEIETAAGYAADLGDEPAIVRVYTEWEARDRAREAAEAQAEAERAAAAEAERAAAVEAAQEAERAAAAEAAQAAETRSFDALGAAWSAAIIPAMTRGEVSVSTVTLGEPGLRQVMGDGWVDDQIANWAANHQGEEPTGSERNNALSAGVANLPDEGKARVLFAAAAKKNTAEFIGWSDADLTSLISRSMFGQTADAEILDQARRARMEVNLRATRALRADNVRAFRQAQIRAFGTPVADLSDAELETAPTLLTVDPPDEAVLARVDEVRAEILRRQADLARIAAEKAAGPSGPARLRNPVSQLGYLERMAESANVPVTREAAERLDRAKAIVYGLPETAKPKDIRAAARKDPRPLPVQAATIIGWYRHLGRYENIPDDLPDYRSWVRGPADEDVPDVPEPLPPANVSNPDQVWAQIQANAQVEIADGRYETGVRFMRAVARAYGIPAEDMPATRDSVVALNRQTGSALNTDTRTPRQRAALFIAEFRRLAAEDGIDPSDTLRYGPPDKGGRTRQASFRASTPDQQRRIDALIARGWDSLDAYAEVHGADPDQMRRGQRVSEKEIRQAYAEYVELQYQAAEKATAGNLINKRAAGRGIDPRALFSGPWSTARANASEELLRFWAENQRMSYADFKASMAGGAEARAARQRLVGAGKGNEFA
jgi:hypothetical protein